MRSLFFKIFIGLFIIGLSACEVEDLPQENPNIHKSIQADSGDEKVPLDEKED